MIDRRHRSSTPPRCKLAAALAAMALVATACAGSGDSDATANGPAVTLGTVPDPSSSTSDEQTQNTDTSATVADTTPTVAATDPAATQDPAEAGATTSTMLLPSPEADLPTQATQTDPAPITTLPGPLPTPTVSLIEITQFNEPVEATGAPGDTRLFVVERTGTVIAVDDESNEVVLDIAEVAATTFTDDGGEQGMLGLAFHPERELAYVHFTDADGNTVVGEFAHDPTTYVFDTTSFRQVLSIDQPATNHNGGELVFGPDGFLYVGVGDGGSADDPDRTALDVSSRLGKILRIDPLPADGDPFTAPDDNPFVEVEGADPTVWTLGLRNPWKFSFDSLTGDLWIGDVGQNRLEEVDLAPAVNGRDAGRGVSFGWSAFEAEERFNDDQPGDGHTLPVFSYAHEDGNCSVSGGVVARESTYPDLNGWFIYGDYCSGRVWALDTTSVTSTPSGPQGTPITVEIATVPLLTAIVEGPFGDIYALAGSGQLYRLGSA
ncbi:MAG: PQQ-dependent sugar dehydrogenase [Ilumatobacter sp.]